VGIARSQSEVLEKKKIEGFIATDKDLIVTVSSRVRGDRYRRSDAVDRMHGNCRPRWSGDLSKRKTVVASVWTDKQARGFRQFLLRGLQKGARRVGLVC